MLYELRKYDVMPGKGPALLDRFGTFTVPKWGEYGIRAVGFWTPQIGGQNNLIYILAWDSFEQRIERFGKWQASPERAEKWEETERNGPLVRRLQNVLMEPTAFSPMEKGVTYGDASNRAPYLFELREYEAMPGCKPALVKRFGDFTNGCFVEHGFRPIGYWSPVVGPSNQQFIYMLAWESYEERNLKFEEFQRDPERRRVFEESEKPAGPLVEKTTNAMLRPTAFSPLK